MALSRNEGTRGAAPQDFGRPVNPISTKGVRLCPPHYNSAPTIFRRLNELPGLELILPIIVDSLDIKSVCQLR